MATGPAPRRAFATHSWGFAWVGVCLALAAHVADEAANGFLAIYDLNAAGLRARIPWLPLPQLTLASFLASFGVAVALLLALTPFALRGARWLRPVAWTMAALMAVNALAHIAASAFLGRWMPGVFSSPWLLTTAIWLAATLRRSARPPRSGDVHPRSTA